MGVINAAASLAFRDYVTDGVAGSGPHEPVKGDIRGVFDLIQAADDFAFKPNLLINGDLSIWQRGTSGFTADGWTADRFYADIGGTVTVARLGAAAPPGAQCFLEATAGASSSSIKYLTGLENADSVPLRNRTLTAQARVYHGGAWSGGDVRLRIEYRTSGTDQLTTGTWTTLVTGTMTPTASQQTVTATGLLPGSANGVRVTLDHSASMANGEILRAGGFKLEIGSVASLLVPRPKALELALCQRYFCKSYPEDTAPGSVLLTSDHFEYASATSSNVPFSPIRFPCSMRATPTLVTYNPADGNTTNPVRNYSAPGDAALTVTHLGANGFGARVNSVSVSINQQIGFHWAAAAELD